MTSRREYDIIRIPSNDWELISETVSLDGSYPEELKGEIWKALDNIRFLPDPWVVVQITEGNSPKAYLFADEKAAEKYAATVKKNLPKKTSIICVRVLYKQLS
ncbi:MAG: hypothetical protein HONDAALG_03800 [Gammaproteobacteria bacterium]|nr:hypothetical protein [Gammaproteobacteria bacterium]